MNANGQTCVGILPDGRTVFASESLIASQGMDKIRYEMVDKVWLEKTGGAPGYYPVRLSLRGNDVVMIKADSHQHAVDKFLATRREQP